MVEPDEDCIYAIVATLIGNGGFDDKSFVALNSRLEEKFPKVLIKLARNAELLPSVYYIKIKPVLVEYLSEQLSLADDIDITYELVEVLRRLNVTVERMVKLLQTNPKFPSMLPELAWRSNHWGSNDPVLLEVVSGAAQGIWWRLWPRKRKDQWWLSLYNGPVVDFEWHMFFDEFRSIFRFGEPVHPWRWTEEAALHLARALGSLRWRFAFPDFEKLMSLRVEANVIHEEVDTLRFRFLDAFGTDHEGRPISEWLRHRRSNRPEWLDSLLATENRFDDLRDEVANLRRRREEILKEAEKRWEGNHLRWSDEGHPELPEDLQGEWRGIAQRLRELEGSIEEPGELGRIRQELEKETREILPSLKGKGVRFRIVEVEGVLGEYDFVERKITLYTPMIELVADELAKSLGKPQREVQDGLASLVEMHETAHAVTHLGIDSNETLWAHPEQGSSELHEMLAQFYTRQLIRQIGDRHLEKIFLSLNQQQPERYKYWKYLEGVPLELVRVFLLTRRSQIGGAQSAGMLHGFCDLLSLTEEAVQCVQKAMPLIASRMSGQDLVAFKEGFVSLLGQIEKAQGRSLLYESLANLLGFLERWPIVRTLLQSFLPGGIPSASQRILLVADALTREGGALPGSKLRLDVDQMRHAQTAMLFESELIRRNQMIEGLRFAEELHVVSLGDRVNNLLAQLPSDYAEAERVLESLRDHILRCKSQHA